MTEHTPTPWFVSGVRFRMNGGEWQSVNRYDESLKRDENVACVGYDPRTGLGRADAHFIVKAVNNHDALVNALEVLLEEATSFSVSGVYFDEDCMGHKGPKLARDALDAVGNAPHGDK